MRLQRFPGFGRFERLSYADIEHPASKTCFLILLFQKIPNEGTYAILEKYVL
jgi:hypothetical protein